MPLSTLCPCTHCADTEDCKHIQSCYIAIVGVQAELILGAIERRARSAQPSNSSYLEQRVDYLKNDAQLVDQESQGVMMAWEGPLMQAHAKVPFCLLQPCRPHHAADSVQCRMCCPEHDSDDVVSDSCCPKDAVQVTMSDSASICRIVLPIFTIHVSTWACWHNTASYAALELRH